MQNDHYKKLLEFEELCYQMYLMIVEQPRCIPDLTDVIPLTRLAAQNMIQRLVAKGHLTTFQTKNPRTQRTVKFYKFTGLEYVKRTRNDFDDYYVRNPILKAAKDPKQNPDYNPYATVYKLLDKRREPAPKSKKKNYFKGIASSFSLMDYSS